jgi:hypothetical protein
MSNEEHQRDFQKVKEILFNNLAIYHERITWLVQLTAFEIGEADVQFKAKILKPLNKIGAERYGNIYKKMIEKGECSFGASYQLGSNDSQPILKNNIVSRSYCPFMLWLDPELTKYVFENDDAATKQVQGFILGSKDWKEFTKKIE